jgi:hypothetical protein
MMRGRFIAAFLVQPAGLAFALLTILSTIGALYVLITGRPIQWTSRRIRAGRVALIFVSILMGGWAYKLIEGIINGTLPIRP